MTILAALTLTTLIAFLALVVDTGRLYLEKRTLQKNADLAAI
ncbi:pilus assembly protein TadG-related protein, partial [Zhongshania sp.]